MLQVSVSVMVHHKRLNLIPPLLKKLGVGSIPLAIDNNNEGIWETAKKGWRLYDSEADYHLLLQDDIIPCKDFLSYIPHIIAGLYPKGDGVCFCSGQHRYMALARQKGYSWVLSNTIRHAQAIALPVNKIEDFIAWSDANFRPQYIHDDGRLEAYMIKTERLLMWHSCPSLVEHDDKGSVSQTREKTGQPYKAAWFIGEDTSPNTINWSTGFQPRIVRSLRMVERWGMREFEWDKPNEFMERP